MQKYKIIELEGTPFYIDSQLNGNYGNTFLNIDYTKDYMKCYAVGRIESAWHWFKSKTSIKFARYNFNKERTDWANSCLKLPYKGIVYCLYSEKCPPYPKENEIPISGRIAAFELKEDAELYLEFINDKEFKNNKSKINIGKTSVLDIEKTTVLDTVIETNL